MSPLHYFRLPPARAGVATLFVSASAWQVVAVCAVILAWTAGWAVPIQAQIRITSQPLDELQIEVKRSVPANVISLREATVASQITATILTLPLLVGEYVQAGDEVSTLDCADNVLRLSLEKADIAALVANQALAVAQLQRLQKLELTDNISADAISQKQSELEVVRARVDAQNITIQSAQRGVDKCSIRSPFAGVVTEIHSEVGNFVNPGSAIISIVDVENVELSARVSHEEIEQINAIQKRGKTPRLQFSYLGQNFPVAVRTVLQVVDAVAQNQQMRLVFSESSAPPGASGRLLWSLSGRIIPASLVVVRNHQSGVFIVVGVGENAPENTPENTPENAPESVTASAKFVAIDGARPGQPVALDMPADTLIIVDGRYSVEHGDSVVMNRSLGN